MGGDMQNNNNNYCKKKQLTIVTQTYISEPENVPQNLKLFPKQQESKNIISHEVLTTVKCPGASANMNFSSKASAKRSSISSFFQFDVGRFCKNCIISCVCVCVCERERDT